MSTIHSSRHPLVAVALMSLVVSPSAAAAVVGPITSLEVSPGDAEVGAGETASFTVTARDAEGTVVVPDSVVWDATAGVGSIDSDGLLTAATLVGAHPASITATVAGDGGDISATSDVTIVPAELALVNVTAAAPEVAVQSRLQCSADATDEYGNAIAEPGTFVWSVDPATSATIDGDGELTVPCSVAPGTHIGLVRATVSAVQGALDVTVVPAAPASLTRGHARSVEVPVEGTHQFLLTPKDNCNNPTDDAIVWTLTGAVGAIAEGGLFTAGTATGTGAIEGRIGSLALEFEVNVVAGEPVALFIDPAEADVVAGAVAVFGAIGEDAHGNQFPTTDVVWAADESVGVIDDEGELTSETTAGEHPDAVTATMAFEDDDDLVARASVTITPDSGVDIALAPMDPTLVTGQTITFEPTVTDQYGNQLTDIRPQYSCSGAGTCDDETGEFTAGLVAGEYLEAFTAAVSGTLEASTSVTIVLGSPSEIEVTPGNLTQVIGSSATFSAEVRDAAGAVIEGAAVTWSAADELGDIDAEGVLTIGNLPGRYRDGVVAEVDGVEGTADVEVPRDFDQDGMDDPDEVEYGFDPEDPSDADEDADGDGASNRFEYEAGTDPTDPDDTPTLPGQGDDGDDAGGDGDGGGQNPDEGCSAAGRDDRGWAGLCLVGLALWLSRRRVS